MILPYESTGRLYDQPRVLLCCGPQEEFEAGISEARRKTLDEMHTWRQEAQVGSLAGKDTALQRLSALTGISPYKPPCVRVLRTSPGVLNSPHTGTNVVHTTHS